MSIRKVSLFIAVFVVVVITSLNVDLWELVLLVIIRSIAGFLLVLLVGLQVELACLFGKLQDLCF